MKRNDVVFGWILVGFGVVSGFGVSAYFLLMAESLALSMLLAPAFFFLLGLVLIYSDNLERSLKIERDIRDFPRLIEDDLVDLREGKITPCHAMVVITTLSLIGQIAAIFLYRKWTANFMGCMNVIVVSVFAGFAVGLIGITTKWFRIRQQRFSFWVYLIPLIGLALSAFLGMYFAEPEITNVRDLPVSQGAGYQYTNTSTRVNYIDGGDAFFIVDGVLDADCDDEACLVLILVVIVIACIAASAFIPHFWVVATTILWVIMLLITLRELLYRGPVFKAAKATPESVAEGETT
jgi:hypothetical protein